MVLKHFNNLSETDLFTFLTLFKTKAHIPLTLFTHS